VRFPRKPLRGAPIFRRWLNHAGGAAEGFAVLRRLLSPLLDQNLTTALLARTNYRLRGNPPKRLRRLGAEQFPEQLLSRHGLEWLECERRDPAAAEARSAVGQLGPGGGPHEQGPAHPLQDVLEQVKQWLLGPVHVLDEERDRALGRQLLESPVARRRIASSSTALLSRRPAPESLGRLGTPRANGELKRYSRTTTSAASQPGD
jgi:hypothetical protein